MRKVNDGPVIRQEKAIVEQMISFYCRKKHRQKELCDSCRDLLVYSHKRLSYCPFGEEKTACANCKIHCYKPDYREKIKVVMRFAGPRIFLSHPILSLKHLPWKKLRLKRTH